MLERHGNTVTVEQSGEARLLIFRYPIAVVVQSDERYPATIGVRVLRGNPAAARRSLPYRSRSRRL
ncbi:MAG TPA: hypothetical protein VE687_12635 [Stellaceae bacterium]|nr:hypothetical protein [Stellaceae bacterium]